MRLPRFVGATFLIIGLAQCSTELAAGQPEQRLPDAQCVQKCNTHKLTCDRGCESGLGRCMGKNNGYEECETYAADCKQQCMNDRDACAARCPERAH